MSTLFISDLHLDEERPQITRLFLDFLHQRARDADALYILGDLFEAWIGDDHVTALSRSVSDGLRELSESGVPIYFLHGNRDFLLGPEYASQCGMQVLGEYQSIDLDGCRALIAHGDTLCTDDHSYQEFRQQVRDPQWQQQFLAQSLEERLAFAEYARQESQTQTAAKDQEIMDVNAQTVEGVMESWGIPLLIHGHTHRPHIHSLDLPSGPGRRIVLGDWYEQGSVLVWDGQDFSLESLA